MNEEFKVMSISQKLGVRQAAQTGQWRPRQRAVNHEVFSKTAASLPSRNPART